MTRAEVSLKPAGDAHHPDHEVGEDGDPDGGETEGQHEEALPAGFGTVGDREVQQQQDRPTDEPLQLVHGAPYGPSGVNGQTQNHDQ